MEIEKMKRLFTLINHPLSASKNYVKYPRHQVDEMLKILMDEITSELTKNQSRPDHMDFAEEKP